MITILQNYSIMNARHLTAHNAKAIWTWRYETQHRENWNPLNPDIIGEGIHFGTK